MKTFTFTPRLDSVVMWLTILALLVVASCMPAFAQADTVQAGIDIAPTLSKQQIYRLYAKNHTVSKSDTIRVFVTRVVDGDTFVCIRCFTCDDSIRIRVLGLDTFEKSRIPRLYDQARAWGISPSEAISRGHDATSEARNLLQGEQVILHRGNKSELNLDVYSRPLRYVILPDGSDYSEVMREKGLNARK
jgi:endonuclease YncB( thermonuclease family)